MHRHRPFLGEKAPGPAGPITLTAHELAALAEAQRRSPARLALGDDVAVSTALRLSVAGFGHVAQGFFHAAGRDAPAAASSLLL